MIMWYVFLYCIVLFAVHLYLDQGLCLSSNIFTISHHKLIDPYFNLSLSLSLTHSFSHSV